MKNYGNAGTYVAAQGHIDLPRPTKRRRGHVAVQPRCPDCRLRLVKPGADHICLDLSVPEPQVKAPKKAAVKRKDKPRAAMTADELEAERTRDRVKRQQQRKTCPECGTGISRGAKRCIPCQNQRLRKTTPAIEAEIVDLYVNRYWPVSKIAKHVSLSQITVTSVLDRNDVPRPGKGNRRRAAA